MLVDLAAVVLATKWVCPQPPVVFPATRGVADELAWNSGMVLRASTPPTPTAPAKSVRPPENRADPVTVKPSPKTPFRRNFSTPTFVLLCSRLLWAAGGPSRYRPAGKRERGLGLAGGGPARG